VTLGLLGNKIGMTQIFDKKGNIIPVTIIKVGPCYLTQKKSLIDSGYNSIQLGYLEMSINSKKIKKPQLGFFKKANLPTFRYLKEYKTNEKDLDLEIGHKFTVDMFEIGQSVNISGLTIGKGNTGNIKQHNFKRGPMTHGSKHHRLQGSLSAGTTPGRVFRGKRMPGRVGNQKCTILGLEIIDIDKNENLLAIKGSIPGKAGNLVSVYLPNSNQ
jgi:large subunit ribosomal protein L3